MAKDYRHSAPSPARPPTKRKQGRSCVWWFAIGAGIGMALSSIVSSRQEAPAPPPESTAATATPAPSGPAPRKAPDFSFESVLLDPQVDLTKSPPPPLAQRPRAEPPPPAEPPVAKQVPREPLPPAEEPAAKASSGTYILQAGSFSRAADAERLRAQLALIGISSSVQAATLSNGKTTHRVRTGAYASKQDAEKARAFLKRHGKDSMAIPVR